MSIKHTMLDLLVLICAVPLLLAVWICTLFNHEA